MTDSTTAPLQMTAREMAAALRDGQVTSVELVSGCIETVKSHNDTVNAFCQLWEDEALAAAEAADRARAQGQDLRPLEGVPVAVKDLLDMAGTRTERGSRLYEGAVSQRDAPAVRRLKATGAIVIGKTTTSELGWTGAGRSPLTGATRTPWNPALTSGGSSSGSAAALGARMVPLALGSDAGGSVRIPAAFCGVFALKGHLGRIPHAPWSATETMSCVGPMSLSVADSALAFDLLKGPDPRDHLSLPAEDERYLDACNRPTGGLRLGFAETLFGVAVEPAVAKTVALAVDCIADALPVELRRVAPDWPDTTDVFEILWTVGRGHTNRERSAGRLDALDPGLARMIAECERFSAHDYVMALKARADFTARVGALFEEIDLLLLPTMPILPFPADRPGPPERMTGRLVDWADWTPFTHPFNLTMQPAASLPCGFTAEGLPVGLQIVGPRFGEAAIFRLAAAIERRLPWRDRLPPMLAAAG